MGLGVKYSRLPHAAPPCTAAVKILLDIGVLESLTLFDYAHRVWIGFGVNRSDSGWDSIVLIGAGSESV